MSKANLSVKVLDFVQLGGRSGLPEGQAEGAGRERE